MANLLKMKWTKFWLELMQTAQVKSIIQVIIPYNIKIIEWVVATINKDKLLSTEKLKQAFSLFDKDGSGSISSEEVKEILCSG